MAGVRSSEMWFQVSAIPSLIHGTIVSPIPSLFGFCGQVTSNNSISSCCGACFFLNLRNCCATKLSHKASGEITLDCSSLSNHSA